MGTRRHIVIATCRKWPDLSPGDAPLAAELTRRGHAVTASPWNIAPVERFARADMVVLRSNWDFHHDLSAFERWLSVVDESPAALHNPAEVVVSHNDKSYLAALHAAGVSTPRTLSLPAFEASSVERWMDQHGYDRVVTKPAWGASGHRVELVARDAVRTAADAWRAGGAERAVLVQQFVPEIAAGEYALVYFGGEYSHALLRSPSGDDFRVNSQYGGRMSLAADVEPEMVNFGAEVLGRLPAPPTYARVDVVRTASGPMLMELELNEPALGLHLAPGSEVRFADALLGG